MDAARKALEALDRLQASTDPSDDFTAINLASALPAPLAAVVRAVVECVEGNVHGAACFVEECDCVDRALKRALDAFNAAALAQGFQ